MQKLNLAVLLLVSCTVCRVTSQCFSEQDCANCNCSKAFERFTGGTVEFALDFFKVVSRDKTGARDNIFVSSFSVHSALTITYVGTRGNTKAELEKALYLGSTNQKQVIHTYHKYKDALLHNATEAANYTIDAANRIYFERTEPLRHCVAELLNNDVEKSDFKGSPEPSRAAINKWVESKTNNLIKDLLPPEFITASTRLVVVNAAYFKAYWQTQFQEQRTTKQDFHIDGSNTIQVDTMYQNGETHLIYKDPTRRYAAIKLAHSGDETGLVVILPDEGVRIQDFIGQLSTQDLWNMYSGFKPSTVNLWLPRFKISQSLGLKQSLISLGIKNLFDPSRANLSGFTGNGGLYVAEVQHQARVAVDEYGTEAAAATAVKMVFTSTIINAVDFRVNRPFVFFICQKEYKSILFIGAVRDPSKNE